MILKEGASHGLGTPAVCVSTCDGWEKLTAGRCGARLSVVGDSHSLQADNTLSEFIEVLCRRSRPGPLQQFHVRLIVQIPEFNSRRAQRVRSATVNHVDSISIGLSYGARKGMADANSGDPVDAP
jgi:hypothetical protein